MSNKNKNAIGLSNSSNSRNVNGSFATISGHEYVNNTLTFPIKIQSVDVADQIKEVIINDNVVIINWKDNTKTRSTCEVGDVFNAEAGFALCVAKKLIGKKRYLGFVEKALRQEKKRNKNNRNKALKTLSSGTVEEFSEIMELIPEATKNIVNHKAQLVKKK